MTPYTLYHDDCLDILPTLEAGSVDAVICDPPYGTTACKWDSVIPFEPMWAGIKRVLKPRGACVLFGSQPFTSALVMSNVKWFRYEWVWDKKKPGNIFLAKTQPMAIHESICVFSRDTHTYNPQKTMRDAVKVSRNYGSINSVVGVQVADVHDRIYTDWNPQSILVVSNADQGEKEHPTQKPLALIEYLVKTYTNEGETVLDFTMGSGTTGHACGNLGRRFIGIEKDAGYFAIAQERIATAYEPLRHMQVAS